MKYFSQYFLLLLILNVQNFLCKKIYLEYNEELDFIEKDGKYYFPISETALPMKLKNLRTQPKFVKPKKLRLKPKSQNLALKKWSPEELIGFSCSWLPF